MLSRASSITARSPPASRTMHRSGRRPAPITAAAHSNVTEGQKSRGHGERDWEGAGWHKTKTVETEFRDMVVRYGELAQATYDNLQKDRCQGNYGYFTPPQQELLAYLSKDYSLAPDAQLSRPGTGEVYSLPAPMKFEGGELSPIIYALPGKNLATDEQKGEPSAPPLPSLGPSDPDSKSKSLLHRVFGSAVDKVMGSLSGRLVEWVGRNDPRPLFTCNLDTGRGKVLRGTSIGYVAVSQPQGATGEVDVALVWRGTQFKEEWESNFAQDELAPWKPKSDAEQHGDNVPPSPTEIGVHDGFYDIYTRKIAQQPYAKTDRDPKTKTPAGQSPRMVVREWLKVLMRDHNVTTVTATGHSLGGGLATLCAFDVGELLETEWEDWENERSEKKWKTRDKPKVTVISFAAPRVGNYKFVMGFDEYNIRALRVVNKQYLVPKGPGIFFSNVLEWLPGTWAEWLYSRITVHLEPILPNRWGYFHAGQVLLLDSKPLTDSKPAGMTVAAKELWQHHNLELYLYLVSKLGPKGTDRNLLLLNKSDDLVKELPAKWWDAPGHRGCELRNGRWFHAGLETK